MNIVASSSVVRILDGDLSPVLFANSSFGSYLVGSVSINVAESGSGGSFCSQGSSFVSSRVVSLSTLADKARGIARVFGFRVMVGPVIEAAPVVLKRLTRTRSSLLSLNPLLLNASFASLFPTSATTFFLRSVENVRLILNNVFLVIDIIYCLSPTATEALYKDLVYVHVLWYAGHSFDHNESNVVVLNALLKTVFS